jgi:hypothetical protein
MIIESSVCLSLDDAIFCVTDDDQPLPTEDEIYEKMNQTRKICNLKSVRMHHDRLCGLVVRGPGYRSRGPGSIPRDTRFSEK